MQIQVLCPLPFCSPRVVKATVLSRTMSNVKLVISVKTEQEEEEVTKRMHVFYEHTFVQDASKKRRLLAEEMERRRRAVPVTYLCAVAQRRAQLPSTSIQSSWNRCLNLAKKSLERTSSWSESAAAKSARLHPVSAAMLHCDRDAS